MKGVRAVRGDREELRHFIQEFRAALKAEALTHPALAAKHKSQAAYTLEVCVTPYVCVCVSATAYDPDAV